MNDVTRILRSIREGERAATDELLPIVYEEMRRLAARRLAKEAPGNTLHPTDLVHEAYLRLIGPDGGEFENRVHFFAAAAEAMRRILIDSARRKRRLKRGGPDAQRFEVREDDRITEAVSSELLDLDEALEKLERIEPRKAQVVKLKYFGCMTMSEIATIMQLSLATVERHWAYARAWLYRELR